MTNHSIYMIFFVLLSIYYVKSQEIQHVILHGNVEDIGYYYAEIFIGAPPVKQSVIIDTGSRLLAFPCKGCIGCGKHMNPYYDFSKSASSRHVGCKDSGFCQSCDVGKCKYKIDYAEGSSISGIMIEDYVQIGDHDIHSKNVSYKFGCHLSENNLFKSQQVDGIMGLAFGLKKSSTIVDEIYRKSELSEDVLALCIGKEDGYMTIGGYNTSLHFDDIKWAHLHENLFYTIGLNSLSIGEDILKIDLKSHSKIHIETIIDSGTTFSYFPKSLFEKF